MTITLDPEPVVPVGPILTMFDPIYIGIDEMRDPVYTTIAYRNQLVAGEPGGGKSSLLQTIAAHGALADRTRLVLFDGKQVELGLYRDIADVFVGPDITKALTTLRRLQRVIDNRYSWLLAQRRRKVIPEDGVNVILAIIDEVAYFTTVAGTDDQRREFLSRFRDIVARGRACGVITVAATQRPSIDVIPKSLRDIFGYRAAFRCTSSGSSDIILGDNWSAAGFTATDIPPTNQGLCYLIAEGGTPRLVKVAYLTDDQIIAIVDYATWTRRTGRTDTRAIEPLPTPQDLRAV